MEKDNNILKKVGKESGFKIPENYFDNFTSDLMEKLPETEFEKEGPKTVSLWQKARPFLYMAAMFVGISLMLKIFVPSNDSRSAIPETTASAEADTPGGEDITLEDYIYCTSVNDYVVYEYLYDQYADAE